MVIRIKKSVFLLVILLLIIVAAALLHKSASVPSSAVSSRRIPVIMYHQISKTGKNTGKYVISAKDLEKDFIYLRDNGYETVSVTELIDFVKGKGSLPEKSVMLTFDDGYETGFTVLYPLLKKYNMKAVISVIGSLTELYTENGDHNDTYSYLDKEEIRLLCESPLVEIGNHSYDMHYCEKEKRKGINRLPGEKESDYKKALEQDVGKMQNYLLKITGRLPCAIAYPFGECCAETAPICRSLGLSVTFTCEEKVNTVTAGRSESLINLGRFNRSGTAEREAFFKKILI